jgi:glycosyltransferase involved in cell wall biosynthesis
MRHDTPGEPEGSKIEEAWEPSKVRRISTEHRFRPDSARETELSIVMPCLNEAETIGTCIRKAQDFMHLHAIRGEVVIGDNGSCDGSQEIAKRLGARVVQVRERGYGNALRAAIGAAEGRYVIMGDSDDSYDFSALERFVVRLRDGCDLVMGNRFRGEVLPNAMPPLHRWLGNPVLTGIGRLFFRSPVGDFHCGLRGFRKSAFEAMELQTTGMEFASEMVIRATLLGLRIEEVPIVLHPDGRSRPPHLRSWRDGWRHLRFMLLFSPRWLFFVPGVLLFGVGLAASIVLAIGPIWIPGYGTAARIGLDVHTLVISSLLCLVGYQLMTFALFTKVFAVTEHLHPMPPTLARFFKHVKLEVGLICGGLLVVAGLSALGIALGAWAKVNFGPLDPRQGMRLVLPAALLLMLGIQTLFASFFLSILGLRRR